MNNKGFTLIELLATIMLLAIIMTVTTVSIINIIDSSKEKSYKLLVEDIKIAAQGYFEECAGSSLIETNIACDLDDDGDNDAIENDSMTFKLNNLLKFGFLKSSASKIDKTTMKEVKIIQNPISNEEIGECEIKITKEMIDFKVNYIIEVVSTTANATVEDGTTIEVECPSY